MQNHCVLGSMKQMDLLRLMIKLDIVLFDYSQCNKVCDKIKYLISEKGGITDSINNTFGTIRIDSYDSLPIENILTFHNVIILTKSVVNKDENNYFYNIFLEKDLYKDKSNTSYF